MQAEHLAIPDVVLITPRRFADARGFLSETFNAARLAELGIDPAFVQDNHSLSRPKFVVRGLHCQVAPFAQGKLVRCVRGAIWDVAVDIRHGSATFGQHVAAVLSAENWRQLWIPAGFLHGFCTLEPECEVIYKVTTAYDPASERGVRWNDETLALPWPIDNAAAVLSEKDRILPGLSQATGWFMPHSMPEAVR